MLLVCSTRRDQQRTESPQRLHHHRRNFYALAWITLKTGLTGGTIEELASRMGKNRSTISNCLRLLELPDQVKIAMSAGKISAGHARALLSVKDPEAVARRMPVGVVDDLEPVEVDEEHGETRAERGPRPLEHCFEVIHEVGAVGKARECVVQRNVEQLELGVLARRHVGV